MRNEAVSKPKESTSLSMKDKWAVILCGGGAAALANSLIPFPKHLLKFMIKPFFGTAF